MKFVACLYLSVSIVSPTLTSSWLFCSILAGIHPCICTNELPNDGINHDLSNHKHDPHTSGRHLLTHILIKLNSTRHNLQLKCYSFHRWSVPFLFFLAWCSPFLRSNLYCTRTMSAYVASFANSSPGHCAGFRPLLHFCVSSVRGWIVRGETKKRLSVAEKRRETSGPCSRPGTHTETRRTLSLSYFLSRFMSRLPWRVLYVGKLSRSVFCGDK